MTNVSVHLTTSPAGTFNITELSLFGVPLALVVPLLALMELLLTCRAYETKFAAGGKL